MTSKEIVKRAIEFDCPERVALRLPPEYGNDFSLIGISPNPDMRPKAKGIHVDEWGAVWENLGISNFGEVKKVPLEDYADLDKLQIPDVEAEFRWAGLPEQMAGRNPDKFCLCFGISIYERIHFIRGLENTWTDIYLEPDNLRNLIDILVEMNLKLIRRIKDYRPDGYVFSDDWGLQNKLMIAPEKWQEFWAPAYKRIYSAAHEAGMKTLLHSCGYIADILDDLIDCGLDVILMDQQQNMGLDLLHERFSGKITFCCPVDIQNMMCQGSCEDIRNYVREMFAKLGTSQGGFIADYYRDPNGAGHSPEAIKAMCEEFTKLHY